MDKTRVKFVNQITNKFIFETKLDVQPKVKDTINFEGQDYNVVKVALNADDKGCYIKAYLKPKNWDYILKPNKK